MNQPIPRFRSGVQNPANDLNALAAQVHQQPLIVTPPLQLEQTQFGQILRLMGQDIVPGRLVAQYKPNEVQTLDTTGVITGGSITLTYRAGAVSQTTTAIPFGASAASVASALVALAAIGPGDVTATGGPLGFAPILITFAGAFAGQAVEVLTATNNFVGPTATVSVTRTVTGGSFNQWSWVELAINDAGDVIDKPNGITGGTTANWAASITGEGVAGGVGFFRQEGSHWQYVPVVAPESFSPTQYNGNPNITLGPGVSGNHTLFTVTQPGVYLLTGRFTLEFATHLLTYPCFFNISFWFGSYEVANHYLTFYPTTSYGSYGMYETHSVVGKFTLTPQQGSTALEIRIFASPLNTQGILFTNSGGDDTRSRFDAVRITDRTF